MSENGETYSAERRKTMRFQTPLDVEYRTLTQNPIYGSVVASDVSKGGISFAGEKAIKEGTCLELRMNVPGDNVPVFATGTVAWAQGKRTGLKITRIAKLDQSKLFTYIYNQWVKVTRKK